MKAMGIGFAMCILLMAAMPSEAVLQQPGEPVAAAAPGKPQDGVRPEDILIDGDIVSDVWDATAPTDTIGVTPANANILTALTSGTSSAQLIEEAPLYRPPQPEPSAPPRLPTERWRPTIPIQTVFYLGLAVVIVAVLLLKARG